MKFLPSLTLVLAVAAAPLRAEPARYTLDPEHVVVAFLVEHVGFARVLGSFATVEGSYTFDEANGQLGDVAVTVTTDSVSTGHDDRDRHLRSKDFLDAGKFQAMTFTAAGATQTGDREFQIDGELTLLGETRPLTLTATWNKSGDYPIGRNAWAMGVSARGHLKRSEFGMDYGVANGWVGDDVEIIIEFEARRQ